MIRSGRGGFPGAVWLLLWFAAAGGLPETRIALAQPTRASGPAVPSPLAQTAPLEQVVFVDSQHGWAAGDLGTLWRTTSGGQRWQLLRLPESGRITAVSFLDTRRGWVATAEALPGLEFTRGRVWYTEDSGRSWQQRGGALPGVLALRFFDSRHGLAACVPSPLAPTGLLRTGDGGRSWAPVPGEVSGYWQAAWLASPQQAVLADQTGRLAVLQQGVLRPSDAPGFGLRRVQAIADDGQGTLWLAGSGGLLARSTDQGRSWQVVSLGRLGPVAAQMDFLALAARGPKLWLAGSPGTVVFHSPDGGRSWQLWPTGVSVPIHALSFTDSGRGWAVGALGTVLSTPEGGRSWQVQRSGGKRAALWGAWLTAEAVPWEALAWLAADQGYLTAVSLITRRDAWGRSWDSQYAFRCRQALLHLGVAEVHSPWGFPLPQPDVAPDEKSLERLWASVHDGRHRQELQQYLLRQILQWRPEVVLTHAAVPHRSQPGAVLLNRLVQQAVRQAADPTTWPPELVQLGFKPWRVKKLWGVLPSGRKGQVQVATFQFARQFGRSLRQVVGPARLVVTSQEIPTPESWQFRLIDSQLPRQAATAGLMSQVVLYRGGEARRLLMRQETLGPERLLAAQRYRNAWALLAGGHVLPDRALAGLDSLLEGVPEEDRAHLLYQFAMASAGRGQWATAAQVLELLVENHPRSPLAPAAARWLACYWAGSEPAQAGGFHAGLPASSLAQVAPAGERAAPGALLQGMRLLRPAELRRKQAARWIAWLGRHAPQVARSGPVQLVAASLAARRGDRTLALRHLQEVVQRTGQDAWAEAATHRRWVLLGQGPPPARIARCLHVPKKPFLDGKLDEPFWQQAGKVVLTHPRLGKQEPAAVIRFARDEQFLYVAGTCRLWAAAGPSPTETPPRPGPRDAALQGHDRVEWFLDLDGDHSTWFHFAVDHRGRAREDCWGAVNWNPSWFVAVDRRKEAWSFEAAIPLAVLTSKQPDTDQAWSLGVKRVVPGVGLFGWGHLRGSFPRPEGWGLLLFGPRQAP